MQAGNVAVLSGARAARLGGVFDVLLRAILSCDVYNVLVYGESIKDEVHMANFFNTAARPKFTVRSSVSKEG